MISRRTLFYSASAVVVGASVRPFNAMAQEMVASAAPSTPDQALAALREGNRKFAAGELAERDKSDQRRQALAQGQSPFATLVCCSDSRVPPELLFGRGLGELFVVRNAGNVVDTAAMGSIEYSVSALRVPLIVVLGHQKCGAVDAAIALVEQGKSYPGSIGRMIEPIVPAVLAAKRSGGGGNLLEASTRANVSRIVSQLRHASEPMLIDPIEAGKLRVVGATYSLERGEVDFFDLT